MMEYRNIAHYTLSRMSLNKLNEKKWVFLETIIAQWCHDKLSLDFGDC